jgi:hypothetical protein
MEQLADRISEKIHALNTAQLAEVEQFVESLQTRQHDREVARALLQSSEPAFQAVWSNTEDDAYDAL